MKILAEIPGYSLNLAQENRSDNKIIFVGRMKIYAF
jgi:hypothetical protein